MRTLSRGYGGQPKKDPPPWASTPGSQPRVSARTLYTYVWETSRTQQTIICVLTLMIAPLPMAYLELQRRIVDDALPTHDLNLLALLGGIYFGVVSLKSALKYALNMTKGTAVEHVARDIRRRILSEASGRHGEGHVADVNEATRVSMLSVETEDMSGFAGDAFAVPLLNAGTILYVAGYLLWVQPAIAALALVLYLPQMVIVPYTQRKINRLARLRIRLTRFLGQLATEPPRPRSATQPVGWLYVDRLYRVRIWMYLRKFLIAELGNYLASAGQLIVLTVGGYLVITGRAEVGILVVFISGLQRISDPWDELVNFYRAVSNTEVLFAMIRDKLSGARPAVAELAM
jgi:ABC-type bacteriocin/lantibiotic exporter with double-glycine peptidase domain